MSQTVTTPDGQVHEFPDEASQKQIMAALKEHGYLPAAPKTAGMLDWMKPAPMGASPSVPEMIGSAFGIQHPVARTLGRLGIQALPTAAAIGGDIGGAAAGAATGPAAPAAIPALTVAGGAAGGAAGKVAQNAIAGSPIGQMFGVAKPNGLGGGVGREALVQGASSAVGLPLGFIARSAGGALTGSALRRAGNAATDIAGASNATVQPAELLKDFGPLQREAQLMGEKQVRRVSKFMDNFLANKQAPMTADEVHALRQFADNAASAVHDAVKSGKQVGPKQAAEGRYWKQVADTARAWLKTNVPGYKGAMKTSQQAIFMHNLVPRVAEGPIRPNAANLFGASDVAGRLVAQPASRAVGAVMENPYVGMGGRALLPWLVGMLSPDTQGGNP